MEIGCGDIVSTPLVQNVKYAGRRVPAPMVLVTFHSRSYEPSYMLGDRWTAYGYGGHLKGP